MLISDEKLAEILAASRSIAVVGLSENPAATSHSVSAYMQRQGYRILPVNPAARQVLGERAVPSLADLPGPADIVNVFRRPEHVAGIARSTLALPWKPKLLFVQLGITSPEAMALMEASDIPYIEDRCIKIEHQRLGRR